MKLIDLKEKINKVIERQWRFFYIQNLKGNGLVKNFIKLGNTIININEIKRAQIETYRSKDGECKKGLVIYFRNSKVSTGKLYEGITEIEEFEKMIREAQ